MIPHPCPVLSPSQVRFRMFWRAWLMSILQAGGVWFIAHGSFYAGVTGFLISFNWCSASRDATDYRVRYSRIAYGLGGSIGTLTVLLAARCHLFP